MILSMRVSNGEINSMHDPTHIRNVAIVAHIDHGKTTLMDALLKQSKVFRENEQVRVRALDSYSLEIERGITIFAKHTGLIYDGYKINLIDTPGHADFSGEVERVLGMVNSVILLVGDGPMPQTRFVLSRALKLGFCPLVVFNKIDRPHANPEEALNKTFDLFVELGATDEQLDFPYIYSSGIAGYAMKELSDPRIDMGPLFQAIIDHVPAPTGAIDAPFLMQAMTLSYNDFLGRQATGRILQGKVKKGQIIHRISCDGHPSKHKVAKIEGYLGLKTVELDTATVGDIVSISGIEDVMIGETLCDEQHTEMLPPIALGEPTLSMEFSVNTSPLCGKDGKYVTMNKLRERLLKEKKANITLKIEELSGKDDVIQVAGKGELHLSILIEAVRREGYEFSVSKPKVIWKEIDGTMCEPYESVHIEVKEEFSGTVIAELQRRKGELRRLDTNEHKISTLEFLIPTRGLMGYRSEFMTVTKGEGILTSIFEKFGPKKEGIPRRKQGALVANEQGKTTPYALFNLQDRGAFFIGPTEEVYEGMIVGIHARGNDLVINVTREKHLTNVRAAGSDENVILTPPLKLTLESAMDFIESDELMEVTPKNVRLRKIALKETDRRRNLR